MAAQHETCTKEEQCSVIRFYTSEGVKPIEIHNTMKAKYGDACLSQQQVYEWSRKFTNGVTSWDETWVHYHIPETKRVSIEWHHSSSPKPKNFGHNQLQEGYAYALLGPKRHNLGALHARGNTVSRAS
jgi:hypothetical protein